MLEKKYQKISYPSIREALIRKNLKKYGLLLYWGGYPTPDQTISVFAPQGKLAIFAIFVHL